MATLFTACKLELDLRKWQSDGISNGSIWQPQPDACQNEPCEMIVDGKVNIYLEKFTSNV